MLLPRHVLRQSKDLHFPFYSTLNNLLQCVFCMAAELPGMAMVGERHVFPEETIIQLRQEIMIMIGCRKLCLAWIAKREVEAAIGHDQKNNGQ